MVEGDGATREAARKRTSEANLRLVVSRSPRSATWAGHCGCSDLIPGGQPRPHRRPSRKSTIPRATSSPPTRPGRSARPSPAPSPIGRARSASRCIWSRRSTGCCKQHRSPAAAHQLGQSSRSRQTGIADELHIQVEQGAQRSCAIAQEPVSLETPIGEEEDGHLGDFIPDDDAPQPAEEAASHTLLQVSSSPRCWPRSPRAQSRCCACASV